MTIMIMRCHTRRPGIAPICPELLPVYQELLCQLKALPCAHVARVVVNSCAIDPEIGLAIDGMSIR